MKQYVRVTEKFEKSALNALNPVGKIAKNKQSEGVHFC